MSMSGEVVKAVKVVNPMNLGVSDSDTEDETSPTWVANEAPAEALATASFVDDFEDGDTVTVITGGAEYHHKAGDASEVGGTLDLSKLFALDNVSTGMITGLHVCIYLIALALLAADPKYFSASACLELAVVGTMILQIFNTAFGSNQHFTISNSDTLPAAVTVSVVQNVVKYIEHEHDLMQLGQPEALQSTCHDDFICKSHAHSTILFALMFSSVTTGLILFVMGKLKLGSLIAFVPLPVECAFLAGCGFKIVKTGVKFLISADTMKEDFVGSFAVVFLPSFLLGLAIWQVETHLHHHHVKHHEWFLPIALVASTGIYYGLLFVYGSMYDRTFDEAWGDALYPGRNHSSLPSLPYNQSWLISPTNAENFAHYRTFDYEHIQYGAILNISTLVSIMVLTLVTVLAVLLNSSRLEEETKLDVDFDAELKVVGISNAVASLGGGFIGFCSVQKTMLCFSAHEDRYFAGLFAVLFYALFLTFGTAIVHFLPLPVIAAFIVAIGMDYIDQWFFSLRREVGTADFLQTCVLFLLMMYDFVAGFLFGMALSLVVFAARYSSIPVIKSTLTGAEYQGNAVRNRRANVQLRRYGHQILAMRLQGFIFFFTAEKLRLTIMHTLLEAKAAGSTVRYLVLEFAHVDNIDSTSIKKLKKLMRFCVEQEITVIASAINKDMKEQFVTEGFHPENPEFYTWLRFAEATDLAVEWAADCLLARPEINIQIVKRSEADGKFKMREVFRSILDYQKMGMGTLCEGESFDTTKFRSFGKKRVYHEGEYIVTQGGTGTSMFFVAEGSVIITVTDHHGQETRVEKRYHGTMVAETGFFLHRPRTANIIADVNNTVCFEYDHECFESIKAKVPHLAVKLHQHVISKMSDIIGRQAHELNILLRHKQA